MLINILSDSVTVWIRKAHYGGSMPNMCLAKSVIIPVQFNALQPIMLDLRNVEVSVATIHAFDILPVAGEATS